MACGRCSIAPGQRISFACTKRLSNACHHAGVGNLFKVGGSEEGMHEEVSTTAADLLNGPDLALSLDEVNVLRCFPAAGCLRCQLFALFWTFIYAVNYVGCGFANPWQFVDAVKVLHTFCVSRATVGFSPTTICSAWWSRSTHQTLIPSIPAPAL